MRNFKLLLWVMFIATHLSFGQKIKTPSYSGSYEDLKNGYFHYDNNPKQQTKYATAYLEKAQKEKKQRLYCQRIFYAGTIAV